MKIDFKRIEHGSTAWQKAVALREDILRKPLGSRFTADELVEEKNHHHIAGYLGENLVATAVLVPEGKGMKMQRVAVLTQQQNLNIGSKMMAFCEAFAKNKGCEILYCHARDSAVNFYLKNGYLPQGDYFDEDGIPHLKMIKSTVDS